MLKKTTALIVGGGPTCQTLSRLLTNFKVPNLLVDSKSPRRETNKPNPHRGGAHFINTRSVEILNSAWSNVRPPLIPSDASSPSASICPPLSTWRNFVYGHSALNKRSRFATVDQFGGKFGDLRGEYGPVHLGLERLLGWMDVGEEENIYESEMTSFTENPETHEILSNFTNKSEDNNFSVSSQFLIGCDGPTSTTRSQLNIPMLGTDVKSSDAQHMININFSTSPNVR